MRAHRSQITPLTSPRSYSVRKIPRSARQSLEWGFDRPKRSPLWAGQASLRQSSPRAASSVLVEPGRAWPTGRPGRLFHSKLAKSTKVGGRRMAGRWAALEVAPAPTDGRSRCSPKLAGRKTLTKGLHKVRRPCVRSYREPREINCSRLPNQITRHASGTNWHRLLFKAT